MLDEKWQKNPEPANDSGIISQKVQQVRPHLLRASFTAPTPGTRR